MAVRASDIPTVPLSVRSTDDQLAREDQRGDVRGDEAPRHEVSSPGTPVKDERPAKEEEVVTRKRTFPQNPAPKRRVSTADVQQLVAAAPEGVQWHPQQRVEAPAAVGIPPTREVGVQTEGTDVMYEHTITKVTKPDGTTEERRISQYFFPRGQ